MANFHSINGNEVEAHYAGGELLQTVELAMQGITGDGPTETAAWLQRTSTSDGPTTAKSIHGRTVRWNQGGRFVKWSGEAPKWGSGLNSWSISADGRSASVENGAGNNIIYWSRVPTGHKAYFSIYITASGTFSNAVSVGFGGSIASSGVTLQPNTKTRIAMVRTFGTANSSVAIYPDGMSSSVACDYTLEDFQLFDLTAMFGAGNEPSNVAEFEALYPESYYPYDAGSLLPVNMTGIETEDADGNPLQTRSIPVGTLRSAGTVYDELTEAERITRVEEVDLGTLTWVYDTRNARFNTSGALPDAAKTSVRIDVPCGKYTFAPEGSPDKSIFMYNRAIYVYDSAYTDAATFKTAMSGVMAHYALATPTVTPYDPPLNMSYRTEQGGTERVMVPTGELSAPPTLVTAQGYTAESLRDAALSAIAPVENGLASTNYGVGSYLIHGGQLCRVTTAIATGEAISIGTNVMTTTVMAEVLALTQ